MWQTGPGPLQPRLTTAVFDDLDDRFSPAGVFFWGGWNLEGHVKVFLFLLWNLSGCWGVADCAAWLSTFPLSVLCSFSLLTLTLTSPNMPAQNKTTPISAIDVTSNQLPGYVPLLPHCGVCVCHVCLKVCVCATCIIKCAGVERNW